MIFYDPSDRPPILLLQHLQSISSTVSTRFYHLSLRGHPRPNYVCGGDFAPPHDTSSAKQSNFSLDNIGPFAFGDFHLSTTRTSKPPEFRNCAICRRFRLDFTSTISLALTFSYDISFYRIALQIQPHTHTHT